MIGAGTIINPIVKVVTTVVILGAVYLFFVKPALDTTEEISGRAFESSSSLQQQIQEDIRESFDSVPQIDVEDVQIPQSAKQAQKLGDCMASAAGDIDKINRCVERFAR